ncbi:MAG: ribonuclease D [Anaerolineales bacterium]
MRLQLSPPIWVDSADALEGMLADLRRWPQLAVDTESNSLYAYQEQVCLIQISTPETDYLIDPLALPDLYPLGPIFANPEVEKIFHAASYDLLCLHRDFDFHFTNIFDTMHAARVLGQRTVGLGALLEHYFGVHLDKRHQKANWAERPLPAERMEYARLDTHYLIPLRKILAKELQQVGRQQLAQEDFRRMEVESITTAVRRPRWERLAEAYTLTSRQRMRLQALWEWREDTAKRLNRPPFKVVSERVLLQLAQTPPQGWYELTRLGLSGRQMHLWGKEILQVLEKADSQEPPAYIAPPLADATRIERLERLKAWRKRVAQRWGVESDVILPRSLMETLAQCNPASIEEIGEILKDSPWRFQSFGEELLEVLKPSAVLA